VRLMDYEFSAVRTDGNVFDDVHTARSWCCPGISNREVGNTVPYISARSVGETRAARLLVLTKPGTDRQPRHR
jgi:hypothetical protein